METTMTTVRLPVDLYEALRRRAFEERRPHAEIIREALAAWLAEADKAEPLPPLTSDPLWKLVGSVPGGPADEAEAHDGLLYGDRVAEPAARYEAKAGRSRKTKEPVTRRKKKP